MTLKLATCMALREAGERHHDNAGGSRKLSAVAADHTMQVKNGQPGMATNVNFE
jgi:hypothetical protein